jgi:hypothetical protein
MVALQYLRTIPCNLRTVYGRIALVAYIFSQFSFLSQSDSSSVDQKVYRKILNDLGI